MLRDSVRLFVNLPLFVLVLLLISSIADLAAARQVDRRVPLEEISTDFEMADGPAWDGYSLVIPDVKRPKVIFVIYLRRNKCKH